MQAPARDRREVLWLRRGIQGSQLRAQPELSHSIGSELSAASATKRQIPTVSLAVKYCCSRKNCSSSGNFRAAEAIEWE
jgi:hypothetical protein